MSEPAPPTRASIAAALAEEEARLRRLEAERAEAAARAESLRAELAVLDAAPAPSAQSIATNAAAPQSPADKVRVQGRHVMGVYPMLPDAPRRDVLVPRRRFRQEHVEGGRPRVRRDRASTRSPRPSRALTFWQRRARVVLTPVQESAARALLAHDTGVFVAPPGVGKTVIGTYLVASRACSTLVLVHRRPLLDQWLAQLAQFLGVEPKEIGQIRGAKRTPTGRIDVAMIQSLVRKDSVADLVAEYGQVIVDECHHLPAVQFERVLREVKARYVVGLTATPQRRDGHHPITEMQLGPVRFKVDAKSHAAARPFEHRLVVRETAFRAAGFGDKVVIQDLYAALAGDEARNAMILNDVVRSLEEGRSPILLTERKDHLEYFASRLERVARHLVVLQGGQGAKADREVRAKLAAIPPNEERLLLATGRYIGEGFDDARLDTLFLALPVSWKGTLVQYTGRLHRLHPGKREVRIFDYVDREVPMLLRMFEKRLRGYRAIGYARGETPLGYAEPKDDLVVEYDEDVLRALDHESATDRDDEFAEWVP